MSENLKLRLDYASADSQQEKSVRAAPDLSSSADAAAPGDDAESQMRKALGLLGDGPRHRPDQQERSESPNRMADRFGSNGLHRRRFVQDGDIPVTVLRREPAHEAPVQRGPAASSAPTSSRLQRTEAALAAETAAREKAERALQESQAAARDLQTKIGHADLARNEAVETLRREREAAAQMRAESQMWGAQLQEARAQVAAAEEAVTLCQEQLHEERLARKAAEKALRAAEAAREAAEQLIRSLSEEAPLPQPARRVRQEPEVAAAVRRQRAPEVAGPEPEPVKWWLNTKPASKRR